MKKRLLFYLACTSLVLGLCVSAHAQVAAKASGNWESTSTWNTGTIPTAAQTVTIGNTFTVTCTATGDVFSTLTINNGGTLNLGTASLAPALTVSNGGSITVNTGGVLKDGSTSSVTFTGGATGSAFTDNGSVTIGGDLTIGPTTAFTGAGPFTIGRLAVSANSITLNISNTITYAASTTNACTISNSGVIFTGSGTFDMTASTAGTFNAFASGIQVGCTINCGKDFVINSNSSSCTINNGGTITANMSPATGGGRIRIAAGSTANSCSLTVNSGGTLSCVNQMAVSETLPATNFTFTNAGTFSTGTYLEISAGTPEVATGFSFVNSGTATIGSYISVGAGASGTITNTGTFYSGTGDAGTAGKIAFTNSTNGNLYFQGASFVDIAVTATATGNTVYYNSSTVQQNMITPTTSTYYNVVFNNSNGTQPGITELDNDIIGNQLTFTAANTALVNLGGNTLTLGSAVATPGTLVYPGSCGWLYGGTFQRWFNTPAVIVPAIAGLFPFGSDATLTLYQPFWFGYTSAAAHGGSILVTHSAYAQGSTTASFTDLTWTPPAGGTAIQGVSNATWTVGAVANGFSLTTAVGEIRYGGNGFNPYVLADLDATQAASATNGSYSAATSATVAVEVNRTGLGTGALSHTWNIGTSNIVASPLPIQLTSFDVVCNSNTALLQWSTATETNNDYFTVEHTQDGDDYQTIATVKGAGNSDEPLSYSFTDNNPLPGISYYRLSQTDYDGNRTVLKSSAYEPCEDMATIKAYAYNGNSIKLNIDATANDDYKVTVMDDIGRIVVSNTYPVVAGLNTFMLPTNLNTGIYIVRLEGNRSIYTKKVLLGY